MTVNYTKAILIFLVAVLLGVGLLMIYSSSTTCARDRYGDSYYFLKRQLIWIGLGFLVFLVASRVDYHWLGTKSRLFLILGGLLLAAVLVPGIGRRSGGAQRWFYLAGFGFQPSELVKYILVIYLADLLSRNQERLEDFKKGFLPPLIVIGGLSGLVILQPDLGSAVSFAGIGLLMLFLAGARLPHLLSLGLASLPVLVVLISQSDYRRQRILAFINPWADPKGSGFQIIQSLIALGSGGLSGLGLGESRQKLFYLPASTTDFIFSILGEELGFVGTSLVVLLVVGIVITGYSVARRSRDLFGSLLALGITSMLALQAVVNMGVSSGLLPTKGLPFPFISYGGSNLISSFLAFGILVNIAAHQGGDCLYRRRHHPVHFLNKGMEKVKSWEPLLGKAPTKRRKP